MAFLPPISARVYPYDDTSVSDSRDPPRAAARKRRLQVVAVEEIDYDVYYEQETKGLSYRSTRAMDEHILARMRDDIRRANVRQANPESAMPEREIQEEDKLHAALQEYNVRMAQSYEEALKLPLVTPTADDRPSGDAGGENRTTQRRNPSPQSSPTPKEPTSVARPRQSTSTHTTRRSAPHSSRARSKSKGTKTRSGRSDSSPYGAGDQPRRKSNRGATRSPGRTSAQTKRYANGGNMYANSPVEYSSGEIDDFIRKEQQRSGRHAERSEGHTSMDSDAVRREKLQRAQELAQRLQDESDVRGSGNWS